ncbi:hypothetical protein EJB05_06507, partial [Eragrostis curvula]
MSTSSTNDGTDDMALVRELPDDVLVDVLRHLPPRSLAASRRVCRAWRDAVDAHGLLRADLLPLAVRGFFIYYYDHGREFFSRPTTGPAICGDLDFVPGCWNVEGHCNGLLLCSGRGDRDYVANLATRRAARLPPRPPSSRAGTSSRSFEYEAACLAFDPAVSPHYEVLVVPFTDPEISPHLETPQPEWPPASYALQVFSSLTGRWEERIFAREEGCAAAGAVVRKGRRRRWRRDAVYWRGAVYLHCGNDYLIRISMSDAKYKLVPMPTDVEVGPYGYGTFHLGRSKKGVYCAFTYNFHGLRIFRLDESYGQTEWVMEHSIDLRTFSRKLHAHEDNSQQSAGPWALQNIYDCEYYTSDYEHSEKEIVEEKSEWDSDDDNEKFEWDSDDDNVLHTEDMVEGNYDGYTHVLGFHPFKEVIFLNASLRRGIAYHWKSSKFQNLGDICPIDYEENAGPVAGIDTSFLYTPCWMDLPKVNWDDTHVEED